MSATITIADATTVQNCLTMQAPRASSV